MHTVIVCLLEVLARSIRSMFALGFIPDLGLQGGLRMAERLVTVYWHLFTLDY